MVQKIDTGVHASTPYSFSSHIILCNEEYKWHGAKQAVSKCEKKGKMDNLQLEGSILVNKSRT